MDFLADNKNRSQDRFWVGGAAVVFWTLAFAGIASAIGAVTLGLSANALAAVALLGTLCGVCVGLYAALGRSRLASLLALPGLLVTLAGAF